MKPALWRMRAHFAPRFPHPPTRNGVSGLARTPAPLPGQPPVHFLAGAAGAALAPAAGAAAAPAAAPAAGAAPSAGAASTAGAEAAAAAARCSSITLVGATIEQMVKSRPLMIGLTPSGRETSSIWMD